MHYVDEGPPEAPPILLLHGEPTWSFLYRTMIPILVAAGHRCVAPDLIGFGRSDKPSEMSDHSYQRHVDWTSELVFDALDLHDITLVAQDWGGLIGLPLLAHASDRFARVVAANTGLPAGERRPNDAFRSWHAFARESSTFPIGEIVVGGCVEPLPADVVAAYDAPFPDDRFKVGPRRLPVLVPTSSSDPAHGPNTEAWRLLRSFRRPFLCALSDGDPITAGGDRQFLGRGPGTEGQPHVTIEGAGHFLQEDKGHEFAALVAAFISQT
jgi:haloalkane dehalogenase